MILKKYSPDDQRMIANYLKGLVLRAAEHDDDCPAASHSPQQFHRCDCEVSCADLVALTFADIVSLLRAAGDLP